MKHSIKNIIRFNYKLILLFSLMAVFYLSFGCPIRLLTGISCPGCGMSRAVTALLKLDFALAFEMHPLVFILPVAVAVYFLRRSIPKRMMVALCVLALSLLLIVYIVRMSQQGNVVYAEFESGLIYKLFQRLTLSP